MIAIIDYNAGNTASVIYALQRLGYQSLVTYDAREILQASHIILPGVGEARSAMRILQQRQLDKLLRQTRQPVLGICLGLQLLCTASDEGPAGCLGIFEAQVKRFPASGVVPHMGWNNLIQRENSPLFHNIRDTDNMYYVHSYYAPPGLYTSAVCDYLVPFSAAMEKDNYYGVQFHPEKSGDAGMQLLKNFLTL